MKGLLLKDLYNLKRLGKQYGVVCVGMLVWSAFMKNYSIFPMMTILSGAMTVLSSFSFDEAAHFEKYALTLPVTKKNLVQVKYLLLLILLLAGFLVGMTGAVLMDLFLQKSVSELPEQLLSAASIAGVFLFAFSAMIPVVFKLGVEKARMLLVVIYMGLFIVFWGGLSLLKELGIKISENSFLVFLGIAAIVTLAIFFISYLVSVKIMEKKEW